MSSIERRSEIIKTVIDNIRANSGFANFYNDIAIGQTELVAEETEVVMLLDNSASETEELLSQQDSETLIRLILALAANFGDTSTKEAETRLDQLRTFFVEE